ncbi:ABC transporter ATP-binding protein [Metabacillus halosaccharovorans]|uniref:ABC transporter ATP-binding protein n=1 Tax=Metabacillus halosaccharovorans TaxID=930124 RepID=UPI002041F33E|nr:ABC transporter ATP-binding protein [Metabacillus halosaccharovorans]MCM3443189.1 ABC transporter ATP-binding protein [Metabacillus halosaccharovorans]
MSIRLSITELSKVYPTGEGVKRFSLDIKNGELVTLLGPSGCGKSTVLRSVGGFIDPNEGSIQIDGTEVNHLPPEKRPSAMVFQSYNLWPHMTVFDNLAFSMKLKKVKKSQIIEKVNWALTLVQLQGYEKKYPTELSGGQQQRIALARALLLEPKVLLLDEPFSALDAKLRHELREELREIQAKQQLTMLFVTHDQEEALSISDRIVVMNKGNIEQVDSPQNIYNYPASMFVAQFIGKMNFLQGYANSEKISIHSLAYPNLTQYNGNVTVAVRPEDIVIVNDAEMGLDATIEKVMMLGHYAEVSLYTDYGKLKMFVERNEMSQFKVFDTIRIAFSTIQAFPEENTTHINELPKVQNPIKEENERYEKV